MRIIGDVAKALDYAHSRRILHRDIKPGNFLVSSPGTEHERVLLADFGIASALDDATALTATGSLVGTAAYAAPEAIEGSPVDHRTDIYSLGCALFRLLTGRTPYGENRELPAMLMDYKSCERRHEPGRALTPMSLASCSPARRPSCPGPVRHRFGSHSVRCGDRVRPQARHG